ncbi:hypothetical protein HH310_21195 [Actinoplanes sp. TBRC 11911]|uniref:hypothetical protein n=1 Tax=Actinoplanes sp. TBRC 11911 TaxID=2729386 RepID=UPI00145F9BD4|nr:hypothetical protein [Actinoplanes sp. TBRC 11911]NMO53689.1 hypothetical protein [Actinoplanes sp. TBRC 11911]
MQDLTDFYSTIAGINFTLLGLWWVAVQELRHLRARNGKAGGMAYVVSLQFLVPGTAALMSQVAPEVPTLWRLAFTTAGVLGFIAILLMVPRLAHDGSRVSARVLLFIGLPLNALVALVAAVPALYTALGSSLNSAQWEGILFCLLVLFSAHTAFSAAMSAPVPGGE